MEYACPIFSKFGVEPARPMSWPVSCSHPQQLHLGPDRQLQWVQLAMWLHVSGMKLERTSVCHTSTVVLQGKGGFNRPTGNFCLMLQLHLPATPFLSLIVSQFSDTEKGKSFRQIKPPPYPSLPCLSHFHPLIISWLQQSQPPRPLVSPGICYTRDQHAPMGTNSMCIARGIVRADGLLL